MSKETTCVCIDEDELSRLFAVRNTCGSFRCSSKYSSSCALSGKLLDAKKSQSVAIHLRNLPDDVVKLQEMLDAMDHAKIKPEVLISLVAIAELVCYNNNVPFHEYFS
jgi:hypothetical protein